MIINTSEYKYISSLAQKPRPTKINGEPKPSRKSYLCQWNTIPITIKWVGKYQLLHIDYMALDYNLFLLHKFTQDTYNKNTLATYYSCINFSQSKDHRFIRPPIEAPHLTLTHQRMQPGWRHSCISTHYLNPKIQRTHIWPHCRHPLHPTHKNSIAVGKIHTK